MRWSGRGRARVALAALLALFVALAGVPTRGMAEAVEESIEATEEPAVEFDDESLGGVKGVGAQDSEEDVADTVLEKDPAAVDEDGAEVLEAEEGADVEGAGSEAVEEPADEVAALEAQSATVADPRVVADSSMTAGQRTTWDCVWLGSYPQTFVTDAATVAALDAATGWSASGDLSYGGATYRRLREADATDSDTSSDYWDWGRASTTGYCYFRWEPIKWRVLETDGSTALAVADLALDDQRYHGTHTDVTWETCDLRVWLNQTFWRDALTTAQQGAVVWQTLANDDSITYGTSGGSATTDRVFLLAESDVWSTDAAARHGFVKVGDTYDEARRCKPSDYAHAMGAETAIYSPNLGNCWWWLRSPGYHVGYAVYVLSSGFIDCSGYFVNGGKNCGVFAVRPALRISLSSDQVSYAGTVSSDGAVNGAEPKAYTVSYDANGGTGAPSPQTKAQGAALALSGAKPTKAYVITYDATGGSVSPASKSVGCTFQGWNTKRDGSGTSYASGGSYAADADVTLYAQWANPTAGTLATPKRSGFDFVGWFTSASGGSRVVASTSVTGKMTVHAHWTDPYNLGDETYSFRNYVDSDSPGGHCFGMSMTSSGYHVGSLDIKRVGGSASKYLYSLDKTKVVAEPICYYQGIQGSYSSRATVAGGSYYLNRSYNIASDWKAVVNYVKSHDYDNKGILQIGYRKNYEGGHAINFLRYESVNGQDRLYAYDNNFPDRETYFYVDGYGRVLQAPVQTFSGAIDCIALRDVRTYFKSAGDFDATHALYVAKDAAVVQGYTFSYMESEGAGTEYVMYEIPANKDKVTIIPSVDDAEFIYMGTKYSFGETTDDSRGELRLASSDEGAASSDAAFEIYDTSAAKPEVTLSKTKFTYNGIVQKPTVIVKVGGTTLNESSDYVVKYPSGMVNVGKYTIKVKLTGRYSGTVSKSFTIAKAKQPIKLKAVKRTAKASKLKKKAVTVAAPLKFTKKAQGKVTYAKVAKGSAKCLTVNKKTGKVTIKKGTKKGTYKVKIKVTAKGNKNYKAGSKTVTCKIVIK